MWIPIHLSEQSAEPLYHQIKVQLRALIVNGELAEGTLLPSIRELAQQLKCSVITIRRVYQDLENERLLLTRQGTGTFVARVAAEQREQQRLEAVRQAMESVMDAAIISQCDAEQLRSIFEEAVVRRLQPRDGPAE